MELAFYNSFKKDIKKIKDAELKNELKKSLSEIEEAVGKLGPADEAPDIKGIKKLSGTKNAYRIKVARDYRIGALIEHEEDSEAEDPRLFSLKRFLHRKEVYKKFP